MQKKKKEEQKEEKENNNKQNNKQKHTRMDTVNTEKRKEKQEVQLLNYQQIPLPCLRKKERKKCEAKQNKTMKTTERKAKAER